MFHAAVFDPKTPHPDGTYTISPICRYHCRNGHWSCERFYRKREKSRDISILLRGIDCLMREKYSFRNLLKPEKMPKYYESIINDTIDAYLSEKQQKERQEQKPKFLPIEIDRSRLGHIRKAAEETRDSLLVETEEEETSFLLAPPSLSPLEKPGESSMEESCPLDETELLLLRCILKGKAYRELLKEKGLLLSVVVESINEKLFEDFLDTVLLDAGDDAEVIEDYREELEERFMD